MKRVLVFGDSNSWGHVPAKCTRYPEDSRWPAVAAALLGPEYQIIEDSISGRTTVYEDPVVPFRCGKDNLGYSMLAHAPLDLVVLALGGNDLKFTDADGVIRGVSRLIDMVRGADQLFCSFSPIFRGQPRILLMSPARIAEEIPELRPGHALRFAPKETLLLPEKYEALAKEKGTWVIHASRYAEPELTDCIHFSPESHRALGQAAAEAIRGIFEEK